MLPGVWSREDLPFAYDNPRPSPLYDNCMYLCFPSFPPPRGEPRTEPSAKSFPSIIILYSVGSSTHQPSCGPLKRWDPPTSTITGKRCPYDIIALRLSAGNQFWEKPSCTPEEGTHSYSHILVLQLSIYPALRSRYRLRLGSLQPIRESEAMSLKGIQKAAFRVSIPEAGHHVTRGSDINAKNDM